MPQKKGKKRLDSSDDHAHDDLHAEGTTTESNSDTLFSILRQELHDMKSGIQDKLDTVISNQQSLLSRMDKIEIKHVELEKSAIFTSQAVEIIQKENSALSASLKVATSELESTKHKILQLEKSTLHLERYSRSYNLRFGGVPELVNESPSYPLDKIKEILDDTCDLHPEIENAHRSGRIPKTSTDKPRHILVKFIYRPDRQAVMQRCKSALSERGIFMLQDLPAADAATKKSLRDVMKKAYQAGKRPVFRNGHLYINGQKYTPTSDMPEARPN